MGNRFRIIGVLAPGKHDYINHQVNQESPSIFSEQNHPKGHLCSGVLGRGQWLDFGSLDTSQWVLQVLEVWFCVFIGSDQFLGFAVDFIHHQTKTTIKVKFESLALDKSMATALKKSNKLQLDFGSVSHL